MGFDRSGNERRISTGANVMKIITDKRRLMVVGRYGLVSGRIYDTSEDQRLDIVFCSNSDSTGRYFRLDFNSPELFDYDCIEQEDVIALLGAMSLPDECEKKPELAYAINVAGPIAFAENAIKRGARIIFASSDIVYGRSDDEICEDAETMPVGTYGAMKREVESHFENEPSFKTIRLSLVYSRDDKFTRYLASCANDRRNAEIYHPIYRSVVHIDDVVDAIKSIALRWESIKANIINLAGPNLLSRLDLAEIHRRVLWPHLDFESVFPGDDFYQSRPKTINMKSLYLENILGRPPRSIEEAVYMEFQIGKDK